MPAQLIERALAEWREGERLLLDLPRVDPDHETVRMEVMRLRETYQRLSALSSDSHDQIEECRSSIEMAHEIIRRVRVRQEARAAHAQVVD